ncbi:MAG: hypothetical protein JO038_03155 [Alphaproteobacteria bacterium]|nr:hypothetical protein [Alphaproteobacteria bacterium]
MVGRTKGGQVCGRERGDAGKGRRHLPEREHGLDTLGHGEHVLGIAEPDAVTDQVAHGASWCDDSRFVGACRV